MADIEAEQGHACAVLTRPSTTGFAERSLHNHISVITRFNALKQAFLIIRIDRFSMDQIIVVARMCSSTPYSASRLEASQRPRARRPSASEKHVRVLFTFWCDKQATCGAV